MGDIFTKVTESIKTTIKEATEQTQKSVDQTVYRTELISKKGELKKLYQQLGLAVYEEFKEGEPDTPHRALYIKINALLKEIEVLENKVEDIVNSQKDSFDTYKREVKTKWNENMANEVKPKPGEDGFEVMKICDECQRGNHVEASYCINCGHKF
ncbi:zinc ribbon domain-containing protein [Cellulosilyticum sp. I15G10I2]|uniref:zinc ribbon domain-containing protein n=1 Tax=Cellulosilyticum sp. I15G10I2 TaxID=1892843 RepID=UPI00085C7ECB|nr:zinc ribbon domain-containing protein [Cellulosilyticum sp. I15G10I2]